MHYFNLLNHLGILRFLLFEDDIQMKKFNIQHNNKEIQFPVDIAEKLQLHSCQLIKTNSSETIVIHLKGRELFDNWIDNFGHPFSNLIGGLYCYYHNSFGSYFVKANIGIRIWLQKEKFGNDEKKLFMKGEECFMNILSSSIIN